MTAPKVSKLHIFAVVLVVAIVLISSFFIPGKAQLGDEHQKLSISVGGAQFIVDVAATPLARERGLSGVKNLAAKNGKLFIFDRADKYGFWMKDMYFPLDIIWISEDWKVESVSKQLSPATYPNIFYPNGNVIAVLEINAGEWDANHLNIGDQVRVESQ
jgi:uncharacterized membrane protein (UPF0127 family)